MSEKKYLAILAGICGVLSVVCLVAFMDKKAQTGKTIETALLNAKYTSQLSYIEVMQQDSSLFLSKKERAGKRLWFGSKQDGSPLVFPVDSIVMGEFLATMEQIRSLTLVSEKQNQATLAEFGLTSEATPVSERSNFKGGTRFSFQLPDGTVVSQVIFGKTNYSGYGIYLKTPESPVYLGKDEFYPWLSTAAKTWAEMDLISRQLLGIHTEKDIQGLEITMFGPNGSKKNSKPTDADFSAKVSRLLSLRGGSLIEPAVALGKKQLGEIILHTGRGDRMQLKMYEGITSERDQEVVSYYVIPEIFFFEGNTLNEGFELNDFSSGFEIQGLNYGFEISPWTWEALLTLAED